MNNMNSKIKKDLYQKKKETKDVTIQFRITQTEKEFFEKIASNMGLNISDYFRFAGRAYARFEEIRTTGKRLQTKEQMIQQELLERLSKLEKLILENRATIKTTPQISPEENDYYKLEWAIEKITRLLQNKKFQLKSSKEIAEALKEEDPSLKEFLDRTTQRAFSALDIALDRLEGEGKIRMGNKGRISWN
ncbi:MAG: hypothetical protein DRP02_08805 [Candidatus Gerdarchaeota archaeon]|nr:MAG: hypothetical protein DRP02_08805 [Candidatus Gerdarchaeota archaeon]